MGVPKQVLLAAGVLLVLTVPLVAGFSPRAPDAPDAEETAEKAQEELQRGQDDAGDTAGEAGQDANEKADEARGSAAEAEHHVVGAGAGLLGTVEAASESLLSSVASAAESAMARVGAALKEAGGLFTEYSEPTFPIAEPGDDVSTSAETVQPLAGDAAAGLVLVVAAGALGGTLLWWVVLQRGLLFGLIPLLSRIGHSEIYHNDARRLIHQLSSENPGFCLNEIVSRTGYSRNAVSYHLFVLEKEDEIVSIKDGKYRRYFPRGGKYVNGAKHVVSALRNPVTLTMAQYIHQHPGTIQRDLCKLLGTTASAACWHAKRLEQLGIIRKQRVANTVEYYPGEATQKYDLGEFGLAHAAATPQPPLGAPLPA